MKKLQLHLLQILNNIQALIKKTYLVTTIWCVVEFKIYVSCVRSHGRSDTCQIKLTFKTLFFSAVTKVTTRFPASSLVLNINNR